MGQSTWGKNQRQTTTTLHTMSAVLEANRPAGQTKTFGKSTREVPHHSQRAASFIPPKMRPSQERSARLSEPLLLAHLSPPVPFSSSSLAVSVASVSSSSTPSTKVFSSSLAHSRSTVSPSAESTPATLSPLPRRATSLVLTRRRLRRPLTQSTSRPPRVRRRAQRRLSSHRERRQRRRSHLPAVPQTGSPSTRLCCLPSRRSQCSPHTSAAASACERVTGHTRWLGKAIIFSWGQGRQSWDRPADVG